jgi:hypothetical protein
MQSQRLFDIALRDTDHFGEVEDGGLVVAPQASCDALLLPFFEFCEVDLYLAIPGGRRVVQRRPERLGGECVVVVHESDGAESAAGGRGIGSPDACSRRGRLD